MKAVAARLGDDVHDQPGGLRLSQPAASLRERDFLRVPDVGRVAGWLVAARRVPDIEPIDCETAFVVPATVDGELGRDDSRRDIIRVGNHAGHEHDHGAVAPDIGDVPDDLVAQGRLALRALHVDDRGFAADRDRFGERANLELGVDRRDERPGQLDTFAFVGTEPLQREGHRVGSGPEVFNPVLARPVSDHVANLLDQRRAGGFHAHAGQNGTGRILHRSGDRRLCQSGGWKENEPGQQCQDLRDCAHAPPHSIELASESVGPWWSSLVSRDRRCVSFGVQSWQTLGSHLSGVKKNNRIQENPEC